MINPPESPTNHEKLAQGKTILVFDVDGVIAEPHLKRVEQTKILDDIAKLLSKGDPVALNTGRSLVWMQEKVINPLLERVQDKSLLSNFIGVGEKGSAWITFNNGEVIKHKDESVSVAEDIQIEVRRIVNDQFSETTFYDETKETMVSTEQVPFKEDMAEEEKKQATIKFQEDQKQLVTVLNELLANKGYSEKYKVDPTTIATDVEVRGVGKALGAKRVIDFLKEKNINIQQFIAFGDSKSDLAMAEEFAFQGYKTEMVYVGKPEDIEGLKTNYPITLTTNKYDKGTVEYLDKLAA